MSIRNVVRCEGHKKDGTRCRRRTSKTNLCYQHLASEEHLKIKKSNIPNAGFGLFATQRIPAHTKAADYTGRIVENIGDYDAPYALQVRQDPPMFIDANRTTDAAGRYSNDITGRANNRMPRGRGRNNAKLSAWWGRGGVPHASVKTTRPVPAGHEIYVRYGNQYWG